MAVAFARALRAAGVERVYGLPGEDHLRLLDALPGAGIRYVAAREESAAAIMAATEAQATGLVGVVLVTLAPGITNAINGLAHAWLDGVPLLVVCGQHNPERAPVIVRQSLDTQRLVAGVCKATLTASPRIHQVLARAVDTAMAALGGPVLLELRDDIAGLAPLDGPEDWPSLQAGSRTHRVGGSLLDGELPRDVVRLVSISRLPSIVVGGACPSDAVTRDAIDRLSRKLHAPVFTSPSALGLLDPTSEWFAGTFMNGNFESAVLGRSDLILSIGLDAKDFFNGAWRYSAPVVAINQYVDTQRFVPTQHQVLGETSGVLDGISCIGRVAEWSPSEVVEYRASVERPFHLEDYDTFTIPSAIRVTRTVMPAKTMVTIDAGFGKPLASYLWTTPEPNTYFTAHGLSTMGYALPAANALGLAYRDRPVVAFMGDGSLLMRASELTVAAEQGIAPVYVAWMDGGLAQIETKQLRQGLAPVGTRIPNVSCARIAEAFGGIGCDVDSLADFRSAVESALQSQQPTLIGARVDQSCRADWYELMRG